MTMKLQNEVGVGPVASGDALCSKITLCWQPCDHTAYRSWQPCRVNMDIMAAIAL